MTRFQLHCREYAKGCGHEQCSVAKRVVLCRGKLPADVLMIGEAPGVSEDAIGEPFAGPAGQLLDQIVRAAKQQSWDFRAAFTNLVGCLPRDEEGRKAGEPTPDQVRACEGRLASMISVADPKLIVMVGDLAKKHVPQMDLESVALCHVVHPAYILRSVPAQQGILIRKSVVTIATAARKLVKED